MGKVGLMINVWSCRYSGESGDDRVQRHGRGGGGTFLLDWGNGKGDACSSLITEGVKGVAVKGCGCQSGRGYAGVNLRGGGALA